VRRGVCVLTMHMLKELQPNTAVGMSSHEHGPQVRRYKTAR